MTKLHPLEGDVKKAVKAALDKAGWYFFMPPANAYGRSGIHDIIALKAGIMLTIETKLHKKEGTPLQQEFGRMIEAHGGFTRLVNLENVADLPEYLRALESIHGRP